MNIQQQREQLEAELRRHRLPRAYIQRLLEEWDDHLADLQEERTTDMTTARKPKSAPVESNSPNIVNIQSRLGDPAQLAAIAAKQYHNRSFLGRHPILTFFVLPLPLIVLGITVVMLSLFPIGYLLEHSTGEPNLDHPFLLALSASLGYWFLMVLPPLGTALLLCRIARRNGLNRRWAIFGCGLVALYCSQLGVMYQQSTASPLHGFMCVTTLGCIPISWRVLLFRFLPRFAFAFGIGLLLVKRAQRLQRIDVNRDESTPLRQAA